MLEPVITVDKIPVTYSTLPLAIQKEAKEESLFQKRLKTSANNHFMA